MSIIRICLLLALASGLRAGETIKSAFEVRKDLGVSVALLTPATESKVLSHKPEEGADTVMASIDDDRHGGMVVVIYDDRQKEIWRHDYGYNFSATPGCSVGVAVHPTLPLLLIHYYGYKWDHVHTLLFVDSKVRKLRVLEYCAGDADLRPTIRATNEQSKDFKYLYQPQSFTATGVTFECIPLQNNPASSHPIDQDHRFWFTVSTDVSRDFNITARTAKPHE